MEIIRPDDGIYQRNLEVFTDERGHLIQGWRSDRELFIAHDLHGAHTVPYKPEMMYVSWTRPGEKRGPHLHMNQTDMFIFPGPGLFEIYTWPVDKPNERRMISAGSDIPMLLMIWPGIVHAYKNVSKISGLVINLPNQLYKGYAMAYEEDIVRFEDDPNNPYVF